MFAEAIEQILKDHCTPAVVRATEAGVTPRALWEAMESAGFLELMAPESAGGAGLALPDLFPILVVLGRYAVPVPLAQSIAARALLAGHTAAPAGMISFAPAFARTEDGCLSCPHVPFGAIADHVLAQDNDGLLLLSCEGAERKLTGVHGSQIATLIWRGDAQAIPAPSVHGLAAFAAALHAALLAGAMQRVFDMTLQYANDRAQFGKSIGKFQAIQHQISVMAEQVAASSIAAEGAFQANGTVPADLPAAIAKARTSEAVVPVASIAHAVHGAIGITEEYDLQLFTRRLHEWRLAHGSEAYWHRHVGQYVLENMQAGMIDLVRTITA